jgi:phosphohistidine swiveling domain-containing protein
VTPFAALADDPSLGGKARSLAVLAAQGHPVPAGFVVTDELFRALRAGGPALPELNEQSSLSAIDAARAALLVAAFPEGFEEALRQRLAVLGARFSVRSSFSSEDAPGEVAAGIYESRVDVSADEVPRAIRIVLGSALAPAAVAYARARGLAAAAPPVAVLIHVHVAGEAHGHAAGEPGGTPLVVARTGAPTARALETIVAAVRVLARRHGPVELEWTAAGDAVTFLQLRPFRAPTPARPWRGLGELPPEERARWRWDAAHNPLPLSPAQAGLVALADEHCRIGIRQRVLGGYLFWSPGGPPPPRSIAPHQVAESFAALRADAEARLQALGPEPRLEEALALFLSVYEPLFGVIQPAARAGREALDAFLRAHVPAARVSDFLRGVPSMASERRRLAARPAEYLALFGDEAPVWDVAEPTLGERQKIPAVASTTAPAPPPALTGLPPELRAEGERLVAIARACAAVGEDDDWLYARLQTAVRRAVLTLARQLGGALERPEDLFYWPLPLVRAAAGGNLPPDPRALARQGRAAMEAARLDPPPAPVSPGAILRGSGTGGRALGRVHRHDGSPPPAGAILVAATLLPTELPLLDAAALVTETGGPLDHVAAQARERGLPAVVGVAGATQLVGGTLVLVDADQGLVVRL